MKLNVKRLILALSLIMLISFALGFAIGVAIRKPTTTVRYIPSYPQPAKPMIAFSETSLLTATEEPAAHEPEWLTFEATAYCPCVECCGRWAIDRPNGIVYTASGEVAIEGQTIAADWTILPKGTMVEIERVGIRTVQDRGGAIKGNRIDIYFESHQKALEYGRQTVKARIIKGGVHVDKKNLSQVRPALVLGGSARSMELPRLWSVD